MKTTGVGQARKKTLNSWPVSWAICVWLLLLLPMSLLTTNAEAAKITFAPSEITVVVAPGEDVVVPVTVSLADTAVKDSFANFCLGSVDGPTWINNRFCMVLFQDNQSKEVPFQIKVPADVTGDTYTSVFRTLDIMSNVQIAPVDLLINVEVLETVSCNQAPSFSDISSAQEKINVRNNKEVKIDLKGRVTVSKGCDISDAKYKYQLTDEYEVLGSIDEPLEGPVVVNTDGTFSVTIPMVASCKGNDKDGRLYTVKFMAENEAVDEADDESFETITVVVLHDNRKK